MANKKILLYLKEGVKRGHSIATLQRALIKQGVQASEIDKAVKEIKKSNPSASKKTISPKTILMVIILAAMVTGIFYFKDYIIKLTGNDNQIIQEETPPQIYTQTNILCLSLANNDISYCNKPTPKVALEPLNYKRVCRNEFFLADALIKKDVTICNNIKQDDFSKYSCIAALQGDTSVCNNIKDTIDQVICEVGVTKDTTKCNAISDEVLKQECISAPHFNQALLTKDELECKKITDKEIKIYDCLALLARDASLCKDLPSPGKISVQ